MCFGHKGVVIIYGRGRGAVEFRKSLALKTCPTSIIMRHVFAPPPNLCTEILPPLSEHTYMCVLRHAIVLVAWRWHSDVCALRFCPPL